MRNKFFVPMFVLILAALVLSACGQAANSTTSESNVVPTLAPGSVQVNAGGATFPLPVYTQWTYAYQYVDPSAVINYNGTGSGAGKTGIIDNTLDFAGSDSLLNDDQYTQGKDLQMYPMLAGAVVPVVNLSWAKEVPSGTTLPALIVDRQTLVDIYNAKLKKWNDPAIVALNPGLDGYLPDADITTVHRSDGSGTTEIFTKALTSFSADWTAGGASSVEWPADKAGKGVGGKGNAGVAAQVINTKNSIGYVELSYAISNGLNQVQMINKAGKTVQANAASVESDMADFASAFDARLNAVIVDGAGEGSWPITGYTYIILHTNSMTDCVKATKIVEFFTWALTDPAAATVAGKLGYSVLPSAVRDQVLAKFGEVTCNDAPIVMK